MEKFLIAEFEAKRQYASIIENPVQLRMEHIHDFFELTLVHSGSCAHHVNGEKISLRTAMMTFIRPSDCHYFDPLTPGFKIINVTIPQPTIQAMFAYLGNGFEPGRLLNAPLPPTVEMAYTDFQAVQNELRQLILYKKLLGHKADAFFHATLLNLITRHFPMALAHNRTNTPVWLQWLVLEMYKKNNYVEGLPAMQRLSGKTNEHLCRSCAKHLGLSPTQVVNDIRLRQAARILVETDEKIIDICGETGFDSLSNFYHLFKKAYGHSPKAFRTLKDPSLICEYTIVDAIFPQTLPTADPPKAIARR
ncbi:MAG: AraC family transcriptional regulator [Oscillospiraceae bacterium]|jgi:AraC family cel operon transcriptional repressor|nr:AraC family transcriptional regulator [Oscillospiraceae bacterium]